MPNDYVVLFDGTANRPWGRQLFAKEHPPAAPDVTLRTRRELSGRDVDLILQSVAMGMHVRTVAAQFHVAVGAVETLVTAHKHGMLRREQAS